jgi:hypothetical protein
VQSWPKLMDIAGDKIIRSMDWPMAEEIADRVEKTIPPELRDKEEGEETDDANMVDTPKGPMPKDQVGPMLAQMDQQMQQMDAELRDAKSGMDKARLQAETQITLAKMNNENKEDVAELQGMIQMLIAKMEPPPALVADVTSDLAEDAPAPAQAAPAEAAPQQDNTAALLAQLVNALNPPKRKSMRIQAPSGAMYQGEILEEPHNPEPTEPDMTQGPQQ